jgi:hypothetical protein
MRGLGSVTLGLALASAVTAAQAQTVIQRQITSEPVETVVTQGPDGTVVTRRPLSGAPVATVPAASIYAPAPVATIPAGPIYAPAPVATVPVYPAATDGSSTVVETVETVQQPAAITRQVVQPRITTRTVERAQPRAARIQPRAKRVYMNAPKKVTAVQRTIASDAPLSLTADQRRVMYRTIVRERAPNTVVTREVLTPPAPRMVPTYPPVTSISTDGTAVVEAVDNYVGTTLGPDTMLYTVPNSVALSVPATRAYRYAYVGDRVLLVDPVTRLVVDDVTE